MHESPNKKDRLFRAVPFIIKSVDQDELLPPRLAAALCSDLSRYLVRAVAEAEPVLGVPSLEIIESLINKVQKAKIEFKLFNVVAFPSEFASICAPESEQ